MFGILLLIGFNHLEGVRGWACVPMILTVSIIWGVMEKLLIRAVLNRTMQEWLGAWMTLALSALLCGAAHLSNPNAPCVAGVAIALEAGIMLDQAHQATGRVWLPIGLHLAWYFTQGGIFAVVVCLTGTGYFLRRILREGAPHVHCPAPSRPCHNAFCR